MSKWFWWIILPLLISFLAFDGFLFYRYYIQKRVVDQKNAALQDSDVTLFEGIIKPAWEFPSGVYLSCPESYYISSFDYVIALKLREEDRGKENDFRQYSNVLSTRLTGKFDPEGECGPTLEVERVTPGEARELSRIQGVITCLSGSDPSCPKGIQTERALVPISQEDGDITKFNFNPGDSVEVEGFPGSPVSEGTEVPVEIIVLNAIKL